MTHQTEENLAAPSNVDSTVLAGQDSNACKRLAWAQQAAALGIPVIPLRPRTKIAYEGWQQGSIDPTLIRQWIEDTYPGCNYGFVMGNGWVCLDLDRHGPGQDGLAALDQLYGSLPNTFRVETPNRGIHLYFSTGPRSFLRSISEDGIDIIGAKSYVVAPFSEIESSAIYRPANDLGELAELPDTLIGALGARLREEGLSRPATVIEPSNGYRVVASDNPLSESEQTALHRRLHLIDPGLPYESWYRVIFAVLNIWGLNDDTIRHLRDWSRISSKWDEEEFAEKIRSYQPNRTDSLGHAFLGRVTANFPVPRPNRVPSIREITDAELSDLVQAHSTATELLLRGYGSSPTTQHLSALRQISHSMLCGLYSDEDFRIAFPLETGMGKTTSVIALCQVIMAKHLPKSVLIACERVEQLKAMKGSMLLAGIPETAIGLLHNSQDYKASIPSITLDDAPGYRFLLACHQRVKTESVRGSCPEWLMKYENGKRDLVVWDESLISSRGYHLRRRELIDSIAIWLGRYELALAEQKKAREAFEPTYRAVATFLLAAKEKIANAMDEVIELDALDVSQTPSRQAIRNIMGTGDTFDEGHAQRLIQLMEYCDRGAVRVVNLPGDYSLLQFEQTIDPVFNKVVILDASCHIRHLALYDPKLEIHRLPITKNYGNVRIRCVSARASRSSFADPSLGEEHFESHMNQLVALMKDCNVQGIEGMIFCHQERKERVANIAEEAATANAWGMAPIHTVHWGQHRASNRYRNSRWTYFCGLNYLPRSAVAAMIVGQTGRLDYCFLDREIDDMLESELAESIYQAISRGNSRNTVDGKAGEQLVVLVIPEAQARNVLPLLEQAMPGVIIEQTESSHFKTPNRSNAVSYIELAEVKANFLKALPIEVSKVSKRAINDELGVNGNSSINRSADHYIPKLLLGWRQEGRSFVRLQ